MTLETYNLQGTMSTPTHLTCHCGLVNEPASLLASQSLPNEGYFCHCDTCRRQTGGLGLSYLELSGAPSQKSLSNVTAYQSTSYKRYFCKECGCNMFTRSNVGEQWGLCAGVVESQGAPGKDRNVVKVMYHEYVGDANDGGIAPYLTKIGGREIPCYVEGPDESATPMSERDLLQLQKRASEAPSSTSTSRGEMLEVACQCGHVQLRIAPPSYDEKSEAWYIPRDHSRYSARFCACRSCRLTLGFSMQPWCYIPPSQIFLEDGKPVIFGPQANETTQIEKLKYYQSSKEVLRSFCTSCGATIFYQSFERPYIIDVSVGVVRSKVGNVLAGEWLDWDHTFVSKRDEAVDEELVRAWLSE